MPAVGVKKAVSRKGEAELIIPKEDHFRNPQLDLFQTFLCNTELERDKLSNTIDLWDSIPKYSVSRQAMNKLRVNGGFLELLELEFKYRGKMLRVVIQPARIKEEDGTARDYYPGANEELVEDSPVPYERPYQAVSCRGLLTPLKSSHNLRIVSNA
jgi:hypothetical protein